MISRIWFVLFISLIAFVGTSCVDIMKKSDFENEIQKHATETINNVWYVGSTEGYDFFVHNTSLGSRNVKVRRGAFIISSRFELTKDENQWFIVKSNTDLHLKDNPITVIDSESSFKIK